MQNKISKIKSRISESFQLITVGLLVFAIVVMFKLQSDIKVLKNKVNNVDYTLDNVERIIDDNNYKLSDVESNILNEIETVKKTVILWSD
jgi:hypothetical protein